MELDESCFQGIDLNSLLTLLVIYQECGVGKAAERLHVTQPAVSNTLAKLRGRFNDPLFVRHARGLEPTAKATAISQKLQPAFLAIQAVLIDAEHDTPTRDH